MRRPRIGITLGDPAGIGPEICLKLLCRADIRQICVPIIFGDLAVLQRVAGKLDLPMRAEVVPSTDWKSQFQNIVGPTVCNINQTDVARLTPGEINADCGIAAYQYFDFAISAALDNEIAGIVTAPLHKEALHAGGVPYPGHTEILAARTNTPDACMMLTSDDITCSLATVHVGYGEVPRLLNTERILEVIQLTAAAMRRMRQREPRLVVCGLNPHAGEGGLFGSGEEERIIKPAVQAARDAGIIIEGPLPPDTAFVPAKRRVTDAYVCMYHDQGLIPLKALAFDKGVNVTLGLPIVRTSVDHGTAFDIAWQGIADESSLCEAVRLAVRLADSES